MPPSTVLLLLHITRFCPQQYEVCNYELSDGDGWQLRVFYTFHSASSWYRKSAENRYNQFHVKTMNPAPTGNTSSFTLSLSLSLSHTLSHTHTHRNLDSETFLALYETDWLYYVQPVSASPYASSVSRSLSSNRSQNSSRQRDLVRPLSNSTIFYSLLGHPRVPYVFPPLLSSLQYRVSEGRYPCTMWQIQSAFLHFIVFYFKYDLAWNDLYRERH